MSSLIRVPLLAALLALAIATPASAVPTPIEVEDEIPVTLQGTTATCLLESAPIGSFLSGWEAPFYWRTVSWKIPFSSCVACPSPQVLSLTAVRFRARLVAACNASADVYIVGATGDPQCLTPDTNQVLCGPVNVVLDGAVNVSKTYNVPLPSGCCITGDAFLLIRFKGFEVCTDNQSLFIATTANTCTACQQFYEVPGLHPFPSDWCEFASRRSFWFQIDADCCSATPSVRHSWGRLKTLYR